MYEFRILLEQFWVERRTAPETYAAIRRVLPQYRRLINEHLGWNLIANDRIIKLEKVPTRAAAWMGISTFQEPLDYCLLCGLLLYLADLEDGEQFLLSHLTEALESLLADACPVDWTRFSHRKALVRVLRHAQESGLLVVYDGVSDGFGNDRNQEVLYENTGLARDFPVHYDRDIQQCHTIEDFEAFAWDGPEADRGRQRIQRIYRQLALTPALYWAEGDHSDYDYIKNQRQWVSKYLHEAIGGELHLHHNGAFWVLEQEQRFGATHPRDTALSDVVLLLCAQLRQRIADGVYTRHGDGTVFLTVGELERELAQCRLETERGWSRTLRETPPDRLLAQVLEYMTGWMLLTVLEDQICLWPAIGKWIGHYPARFMTDTDAEEEYDEPLEDA